MKPQFSLVIPTYNEANNIGLLCQRLQATLIKTGLEFEIIVVDDDSPDKTWAVAQELAQKNHCVKVIRRMVERGLGSAVVAGWQKAEGDILGVIDGDLQHPPDVLIAMLQRIISDKNIDIVIASRYITGGGISRWSAWRRMITKAGTKISSLLLKDIVAQVKDPMSGYFILRRSVIKDQGLTPMGYKILLEVLAKGDYRGVLEIPYVFQERSAGGSKAGFIEYIRSFMYMLRLRKERTK